MVIPIGLMVTFSSPETRAFNWINVALEVYSVDDCDEFAGSPMTISELVATDQDGATIVPEWTESLSRICGGALTVTGDSWTVSHQT